MLLKKGAEAEIHLEEWYGRRVIRKTRISKAYRLNRLDEQIRRKRTIYEAALIHEAKKAGVPTPIIYLVDPSSYTIIMEYLDGPRLKEELPKLEGAELHRVCRQVGESIGKLHAYGIVHGDLTTSNMILIDKKVYFVDFGLAYRSKDLEDTGSDLLLMERALKSGHYSHYKESFKAVLEGYEHVVGEEAERVVKKMKEIERRGRYFERVGG